MFCEDSWIYFPLQFALLISFSSSLSSYLSDVLPHPLSRRTRTRTSSRAAVAVHSTYSVVLHPRDPSTFKLPQRSSRIRQRTSRARHQFQLTWNLLMLCSFRSVHRGLGPNTTTIITVITVLRKSTSIMCISTTKVAADTTTAVT